MKFVFYYHRYLEKKNVKLIIVEFTDLLLFGGINLLLRIWEDESNPKKKIINVGKYMIDCNFYIRVLKILISILKKLK